jgi:uncharacterized membrane protein
MIQLYLLSIVLNGLIGFLLVFGETIDGGSTGNGFKISFSSWSFSLVIGILAAITGVLKLLSPIPMEKTQAQVFILGDLLPAVAGIAAGFILIFGFYRENSAQTETDGKLNRIGDASLRYKKAIGIALLVIAALHFLFPTALFL